MAVEAAVRVSSETMLADNFSRDGVKRTVNDADGRIVTGSGSASGGQDKGGGVGVGAEAIDLAKYRVHEKEQDDGTNEFDDAKGAARRVFIKDNGLCCVDVRVSNLEALGQIEQEWMKGYMKCVGNLEGLHGLQDVYKRENGARTRIDGYGQRFYFKVERWKAWETLLVEAMGIPQDQVHRMAWGGQATAQLNGKKTEVEWAWHALGGTEGDRVNAVIGMDGREKARWPGSFVVRSAMATKAMHEEMREQFPTAWQDGSMSLQLRRVVLGQKKLTGDKTDKMTRIMGWALLIGREDKDLASILEEGRFDWAAFAKRLGVDKVELVDYGRAAEVAVGAIGPGGYKSQAQYEEEQTSLSRKQVMVFHFDDHEVDRAAIRLAAEQAIGKEMVLAGVAETDAKGEEYARGNKLVEDIWIGKQTVNGKPFGIITCKDDVSAMQLLEAHSCGGGEMRGVFGKWSRYSAGEPRHQREARRKVKEGARPEQVWGKNAWQGKGGTAAGGFTGGYTEAELTKIVETTVLAAVKKAMDVRDEAERRRARAETERLQRMERSLVEAVGRETRQKMEVLVGCINTKFKRLGLQIQNLREEVHVLSGGGEAEVFDIHSQQEAFQGPPAKSWVCGYEDMEEDMEEVSLGQMAEAAAAGGVGSAQAAENFFEATAGYDNEVIDEVLAIEERMGSPVRVAKTMRDATGEKKLNGDAAMKFIKEAMANVDPQEVVAALMGTAGYGGSGGSSDSVL